MTMDWEQYFTGLAHLHNDAAVEAVIKAVCYRLRATRGGDWRGLEALEVGCGAGVNLEYLARRGMRVSAVDVSPTAVATTARRLAPYGERCGRVVEQDAATLPFDSRSMDVVIEACTLQHLARAARMAAYREVARVLKPSGLFVGYCLSQQHTVFCAHAAEQLADDPGTLVLRDSRAPGCLPDIGLTHFFAPAEFAQLLPFAVECLPVMFTLPRDEAARRGYEGVYEDHFYLACGVST